MSKTENVPEKKWIDRVLRGGSWVVALAVQTTLRRPHNPGNRYSLLGVRLVEVIDEQDENLPEKKGSDRVNRGSCWLYFSQLAQLVAVGSNTPSLRSSSLGFRLVEVIDEQD